MENVNKHGNLYGINISTNIFLPINIPYGIDKTISVVKNIISNSTSKIDNYNDYLKYGSNAQNNVIYKRNKSKYLIETDMIGSVLVDQDGITYYANDKNFYDVKTIQKHSFMLSYGLGMAMFLRLNNYFILHASALKIKNKNILIMGVSGVGKSTLCSYLIRYYNAEIISDDMSCIKNEILHGGFKMMRLWPQTLETIFQKDSSNYCTVGAKGKVYFPLPEGDKKTECFLVDQIVFLESNRNGEQFSYRKLQKNELIYNLITHIYNRPSLTIEQINDEINRIIKFVKRGAPIGFVFNTPRTYESLNEMAKTIVNL